MMRRLATGLAAAALGVTVVGAAAAPALADPGYDGGYTRLQFDANPEPVWRGKTLTLEGKLSVQCDEDYISGFVSVHHADDCSDSESWHRLGHKRITILFKPSHSGRWHYVDTVRTSGDGYFHTTARAYTSGTWRAVFDGSHGLEPAESTDWVKVVGRHH
ncbi:hypothetical protein ACWGH8_20755 [Nonomuraea muscovyensis]|uniref:Uncharacterized protein n=1 Tax=Nonomuraea muscovyensis TaxID=1124761 RepID=A0A7X0C5A9_9ACTN|nr:hypothetical protein [Nonomuraea muscovyensis]MBB6348398.1 hypothetical protein [Nonomuraea muscovyensis]MDF2707917.1 hypothetical protein [Nonomuraea muscovyensis]